MNAAELLVKCLEAEGVEYIFGVPGEENQDFLFALEKTQKIKFIPTRHEQGAAFIANVIGRLTRKAGVCLATLGPGATNLVTGIAEAYADYSPMVVLTAQAGTDRLHQFSHQNIDVRKMLEPITLWSGSIMNPDVTAEIARKAFKIAQTGRMGTSHIELPENTASEIPKELTRILKVRDSLLPAPHPDLLRDALKLLSESTKPLIIIGNGAVRRQCSRLITEFVLHHNIPVVHTFKAKGTVSDRLDQSLFCVGLNFEDYVSEALEASDLILTIGYDLVEYSPDAWNAHQNKRIIYINDHSADVYHSFQPEVEIVGDISAAVRALNEGLSSHLSYPDWYADIRRRIVEDIETYRLGPDTRMTVPGLLHIIRDKTEDNALLISDVGAHKMWIARNFPTYEQHGVIISNGLASMGISLPGGIAAALVQPEKQIVCFMGDGGFLMNVQELETAKRLGLSFTIVVTVDDDYGLISWKQERDTGKSTGTRFSNPDFVKLAEAFGLETYHPQTSQDFAACFEECLKNGKLNFIAAPIHTYVNEELTAKLQNYFKAKEEFVEIVN